MSAIFEGSTIGFLTRTSNAAWVRAHQRAVLVVDRDLRLHFRNVLRQHALAVAENVGRERHVAELGPDLRERLRLRRHALARVDHQHGGPPAGHLVVVDQIGFQLGAALGVFDPFVLQLGLSRAGGERDDGQKRCKHPGYRHGSLLEPFYGMNPPPLTWIVWPVM